MELSRFELIRKVAKMSGISQPNVRKVLNGLEMALYEESKEATYDEEVMIKIASGIHYRCKRVKNYIVRDPSNGTSRDKGEELVPSVRFTPAFRGILNERQKKADYSRQSFTYKKMMQRLKQGGAFNALKKEDTNK